MLSHQVLWGLNEAIEFRWWKAKFSLPFPLESDAQRNIWYFSASSPGPVPQPLSVRPAAGSCASCLSWHQELSHQHQTLVWRRTCASAKLCDTLHNQGKHFYPSLSRPCCPKFPFTSVQHSFQCCFSWSYPAAVPELTASCRVDPTGSPSRREGGLPLSPRLTAF